MGDADAAGPLAGRRIALLETREAERLATMLRQQGAEIVSCPMVAIVDPADPGPALAWIGRFVASPCDDLVLLTGEGLARLHGLAQGAGHGAAFVEALRRTRTMTRGPKPARALRLLGLRPGTRAPEPTTDGIIGLLSGMALRGRRVGVQLYPNAGARLVEFIASAGADPDPVTPYDYAPRAAEAAIAGLVDRIAAGEIDAVAFTSAPQVRRLFAAAEATGRSQPLAAGLGKIAIAAIGPIVADELRRHGANPAILPDGTYFMKPLVTAIVAQLGNGPALRIG
jgi:uroporphyrinogen-III synthase